MDTITEEEFILKARQEKCRAKLEERNDAVSPKYVKYVCSADELFCKKTYPTWRTNMDATKYIGAYETPRGQAFPISFGELAKRPHLFSEINFIEHEVE